MLKNSVVKTNSLPTVLGATSIIGPTTDENKRKITSEMMLTSLIDAFSILMVFLLFNFSSAGELLSVGKDMQLPKASGAELERNPVVKFDNGKYFIEATEVTPDGLVQALLDLRKQYQETRPGEEFPGILTVQADRRVKFEQLSSIVQASAHAGYGEIKFAVVMN